MTLNENKIKVSKINPLEVTNIQIMNLINWFIQNISYPCRNKIVFDKIFSDRLYTYIEYTYIFFFTF